MVDVLAELAIGELAELIDDPATRRALQLAALRGAREAIDRRLLELGRGTAGGRQPA